MVLVNCVVVGLHKPYEEKTSTREAVETSIFVFFVLEMLMKMLALGVYGYKTSYLSNKWNKFDVFINCENLLDYVLAACGIPFAISPTLGPMRLISRVQSVRLLVNRLLDTLPMLANVFILCFSAFATFGIVGVQLWAGQLRYRCFLAEDIPINQTSMRPFYMPLDDRLPFICSPDIHHGMQHCSDVPPLMEDGRTCSLALPPSSGNWSIHPGPRDNGSDCVNWNRYYSVCRKTDTNPYMGAINFDNIGYSMITMFQVATLEGWSQIMHFVMDASSSSSFVFFLFVTILGSFIMMNVCAVIIATQFSQDMEMDEEEQYAVSISALWCNFIDMLEEFFNLFKKFIYRDHRKVGPRSRYVEDKKISTWDEMCTPCITRLERFVKSSLFEQGMMFFVFLSILPMVVEHHEQPPELTRVLRTFNIILTYVFVLEMKLKLLTFGWKYFKNRDDILDFVIVITSISDLASKASSRWTILRASRLLRLVRLVRFLPYLSKQLQVLKMTMEKAAELCKLLLFVIFVFSILGMQLFGDKFILRKKNGNVTTPRKNFDTLLSSMVTVFQILTLEDWNLVMYNGMTATSPWGALYFIGLISFGKYVLLNILVGVVVQSFHNWRPSSADLAYPANEPPDSPTTSSRPSLTGLDGTDDPSNPTQEQSNPDKEAAETNEGKNTTLSKRVRRWCKEREDWSLYILPPQSRFRIFCLHMIAHKAFDWTILFFILLSCVTLAMERPAILPRSTERWILTVIGHTCSAVYLVEMLIKVLALGFLFGKESYCHCGWNILDGSLVMLSLLHVFISLVISSSSNMLGIFKVLRLLRTLRPLRVIQRAPRLKLALEALIASLKPIANLVVICCAFLIFYAILGVQLFKGKFHHCVGEDVTNITTKFDCLSANYTWERKVYNFDNVPQALMSLFVMYSKDGWVTIMDDGIDAVDVDKQPVTNHNKWMLLFFIPFMMMSFLLLDMFIGVIVETFHQCQQEQKQRDRTLAKNQKQQSAVEEAPYYKEYSALRGAIYTLCDSKYMDPFMTVIIFISIFIMAFEHYNQPMYIDNLTEYSHYVFTAIVIIEVLLKVIAFGPKRFIANSWNVLDLLVILFSVMSIISKELHTASSLPINPSILRACRVLRLAQVLKAKRIRILLNTIMKTLAQVRSICFLFVFFFFIYAVMAVELFAKLECDVDHPCLGLNHNANFKNFGFALLTLYQICTGDNWSMIMKDTLRPCRPDDKGCLGYLSWVAPICFISFVILAQFVLVNLVVAAVMQALEDSVTYVPQEDEELREEEERNEMQRGAQEENVEEQKEEKEEEKEEEELESQDSTYSD